MARIIYNNLPPDPDNLADDKRNVSLGRFMTAWSEIESVCGFLFANLSKLESDVAFILYDQVKDRNKLLKSLCEMLPNEADRLRILPVLTRVGYLSTKRNRIVHAGWGLIDEKPARFWHGLTSSDCVEIRNNTPSGSSLRAKKIFTVEQIDKLTDEAVELRGKLQEAVDRRKPPVIRRALRPRPA